jgi:hypothetical protein
MWVLNSYTNLLEDFRVDNELKSRFVARTIQERNFSVFDKIVKVAREAAK